MVLTWNANGMHTWGREKAVNECKLNCISQSKRVGYLYT